MRTLTKKEIVTIPFWANQNIFYEDKHKNVIREKYGINNDAFLLGSFQRDTEGRDLISPTFSSGLTLAFTVVMPTFSATVAADC